MKKTYITPSVEAIKMETTSIVAASLNLDNNQAVDTSVDGGQLGREDRPSRPGLWEQGW